MKENKIKHASCVKKMEDMMDIYCTAYGDADKVMDWFGLAEGCIRNLGKDEELKKNDDEVKKQYEKMYE